MAVFNCNYSIGQISSKSTIFKPSNYTPSFNLEIFERSLQNKETTIPISNLGRDVKSKYNQYRNYPLLLEEGWHKIFAVAEINNIPSHCYMGMALLIKKDESGQTLNYIQELKIDNKMIDFELSGELKNCKTNVLWECGRSDNATIYCGFDIYFLDALETYHLKPIEKNVNNSYNSRVYENDEFYDGYRIVEFARQVNFKPQYYKREQWEKAVIAIFSTNDNSLQATRQINIEAMYLCSTQSNSTYENYVRLYGKLARSTFDKYCRLFVLLLKTDAINQN
jgi:hypothetical protein